MHGSNLNGYIRHLKRDMTLVPPFDYNTAFSRNIGWLTQAEQDRLRNARIVIARHGRRRRLPSSVAGAPWHR